MNFDTSEDAVLRAGSLRERVDLQTMNL